MNNQKKYPLIEKMQPRSCLASKTILSMRIMNKIYKKHLKPHKITQSQLGIMMVMAHFKQLPQADLGRMMLLERSTVTRDLKRLVDSGYLQKEGVVNKLDILITEKGLNYLESILPAWNEAMKEAEAILGEDGMMALDVVLSRLSPCINDL